MSRSMGGHRIILGASLAVSLYFLTHWPTLPPDFAAAPDRPTTECALPAALNTARLPLSHYVGSPIPGLFGHLPIPLPAAAEPASSPAPAPAPPAPAPPAPDPLADFVFTGFLTVDGQPYALVEHRTTRQGEYIAVGDDFQGFHVSGISRESLTLTRDSEPRTLALNNRFSLTPLNKDAIGAESAAQPAAAQATAYTALLSDSFTFNSIKLLIGRGGEDMRKLNEDYFEGRISQEEFQRRTSGSLNDLTISGSFMSGYDPGLYRWSASTQLIKTYEVDTFR